MTTAALGAMLALSGCATATPTSTDYLTLPPAEAMEVVTDDDYVEALRQAYESAYNALPTDQEMPYAKYQALFGVLFEQAKDNGIILRRNPVASADGFTLKEEEKTTFGHALLVDVIGATGRYCLASTQAISPDYVPENLKGLVSELPHEFVVLKGECTAHVSLLELATR